MATEPSERKASQGEWPQVGWINVFGSSDCLKGVQSKKIFETIGQFLGANC